MERLTIPDEKIEGGVRRTVIDARKVKKNAMTIYWSLKKYEDTGLTPEQIRKLNERNVGVKPISSDGCNMCSNCCERLMPIDRFCPNCGQRIKWEE